MSISDHQTNESCLGSEINGLQESNFLEKYFGDLITDNCQRYVTPTIYRTLTHLIKDRKAQKKLIQRYIDEQRDLQTRQKVHYKYFFAKTEFSFKQLTEQLKELLIHVEQGNNNSTIDSGSLQERRILNELIEIFQNDNTKDTPYIQEGELIYIDTQFKITNSDLKKQLDLLKSRIQKQLRITNTQLINGTVEENFLDTFQHFYNVKSITVLLFYNGDVNFDFERYYNLHQIKVGHHRFQIKFKAFYVSTLKLHNNFCEQYGISPNNLITERTIAFYELNRWGKNKININHTINELMAIYFTQQYSFYQDYKFYLAVAGCCSLLAFACYRTRHHETLFWSPVAVFLNGNGQTMQLKSLRQLIRLAMNWVKRLIIQ